MEPVIISHKVQTEDGLVWGHWFAFVTGGVPAKGTINFHTEGALTIPTVVRLLDEGGIHVVDLI